MGHFAGLEAIPELPPLSCANSQIPSFIDVGSDFCSFVNYKAARMYPKSEFTYHNPGNPITTDIQQSSAILFFRDLFRDISNNSKSLEVSQSCLDVMSDFACLQAFPACPLDDLGSSSMQSVAYLTPCKVHCKLIDYYCIRPLKNQKLINPYYLSHWYHCCCILWFYYFCHCRSYYEKNRRRPILEIIFNVKNSLTLHHK